MHIINYFPSKNYVVSEDCLKLQQSEYQSLLDAVLSVEGVKSTEKSIINMQQKALAFYVAALNEFDPNGWLTSLVDLKNRIKEIKNSYGDKASQEIAWTFAKMLSILYKASLHDKVLNGDAAKINSLRLWQMIDKQNSSKYTQGKVVYFGGVLDEFVPTWYQTSLNTNAE